MPPTRLKVTQSANFAPAFTAGTVWEAAASRLFVEETRMQQATRELYRSANGDRWSLIRDDGKVLVLHEPNTASGGRSSRIGVGDFLVRDSHGPQHAELLRLIGTLVDETDDGRSTL
jgi:hypothetical protein